MLTNHQKILLVEDDELMYRMYEEILNFGHYDILIAKDGEEGWKVAKENKLDLILLDVMMPKMSGMDLLKLLKSDPQTKDVPVVMLTNLADERMVQESLNNGAVGYMVKSAFTPEEVLERIKAYLSPESVK